MPLKDILVHVDSRPPAATRLALAVALAQRHGARLTGLHIMAHGYYGPRLGTGADDAEAAETLFSRQTVATGIPAVWRCLNAATGAPAGIAKVLIRQTHSCDLVVVSQSGPASRGAGLPERLVLAGGRPVLVVPHSGNFPTVGERVLVAWSSGRGACRALHDALPILSRASKVTLLEVTGQGRGQAGEADLCSSHLAQHGVAVSLERQAHLGGAIGDLLLNRACDQGFDLLVMGAGSPTSAGPPGVGAVAGQILRQMTIPVLLAY